MKEALLYLVGIVVAAVGGLFAVQKKKTSDAQSERNSAVRKAIEIAAEAEVEAIKNEHKESRNRSGSDWFNRWASKKPDK